MIKRIKRDLNLVDKRAVAVLGLAVAVGIGVIVWGVWSWSVTPDYERRTPTTYDELLLGTLELHNETLVALQIQIAELETRIEELEGR